MEQHRSGEHGEVALLRRQNAEMLGQIDGAMLEKWWANTAPTTKFALPSHTSPNLDMRKKMGMLKQLSNIRWGELEEMASAVKTMTTDMDDQVGAVQTRTTTTTTTTRHLEDSP